MYENSFKYSTRGSVKKSGPQFLYYLYSCCFVCSRVGMCRASVYFAHWARCVFVGAAC